MANEQNLKKGRPPFKSGEEAQKMGRKGGLVKSMKKTYAARLREFKNKLKLGKIPMDNPKWYLEMLEHPEAVQIEMMKWYEQASVDPGKSATSKFYMAKELKNAIHGEIQKVESKNVNINVGVSVEEWAQRLFEEEE